MSLLVWTKPPSRELTWLDPSESVGVVAMAASPFMLIFRYTVEQNGVPPKDLSVNN
jgi:hypothetical protein